MIILSFLASEVGEACCCSGGRGGWSRKIILDRVIFLVGFSGDTGYSTVLYSIIHLHSSLVYCGIFCFTHRSTGIPFVQPQ